MLLHLIELSRPKHWSKNVFVFMPVPFALASGAALDPRAFLLVLLGFCCANSAVYAFNDARDAERDKLHETKQHRPVASGRVPVRVAYAWAAVLVGFGAVLMQLAGAPPGAFAVFGTYLGINLAYSLGAKHVPLLDVFLLSSGFLLRVLLGCALLRVHPSNWMLLCSYALALFIALAKRRGDVIKGLDGSHRPSLAGYNQAFLDQAMGISAALTILGYALYCMEAVVLRPGREFAALPFVVFGVFDYLRLAHVKGVGAAPEDVVMRSPGLLLTGLGWLLATLWSVRIP